MPERNVIIFFSGAGILSLILIFFVEPFIILLVLASLLIFYLSLKYPVTGFLILTFVYAFIDLQIIWGNFNVPYVDAIAALLFLSWVINTTRKKAWSWKLFPGIIFYLLFLLSVGLSFTNTPFFSASLKYALRPLAFFYLMFVLLPYNLISSKEQLIKVLKVFYGVGLCGALMGLISFLTFPASSFFARRALPLGIFGLYPLGSNHNQLAEILIVSIPLGLLLTNIAKTEWRQKFCFLGVAFMTAIGLLTFSRSFWIAAFVMLLIYLSWIYQKQLKKIIKVYFLILLVCLPVFIYFFINSEQLNYSSSNENRWALTQIALNLWKEHPWIGNGAGTYMEFVARDQVYLLEYGSPLDAHGFAWKLLAELGIFGLVTWLAMLGYIILSLVKAWYHNRHSTWHYFLFTFLVLGIGTTVFQFLQVSYFNSRFWLPLGIGLVIVKLANTKTKLHLEDYAKK